MSDCFYGKKDQEFLAGSQNFANIIVAIGASLGLTALQISEYETRHAEFAAALAAATDPVTRTTGKIAAKNDAKAVLKKLAQHLAAIIRANPGVTQEQLLNLGIAYDTQRTPAPVPANGPGLDLISAVGWTVTGRVHNTDPTRRGKPEGVAGASIFSFVGTEPPVEIKDWKFERDISRSSFQVTFPPTLAPGTRVFIAARWFNIRMQHGPVCAPESINLPGGAVSQAA